jgi:hypothetical protein
VLEYNVDPKPFSGTQRCGRLGRLGQCSPGGSVRGSVGGFNVKTGKDTSKGNEFIRRKKGCRCKAAGAGVVEKLCRKIIRRAEDAGDA